MSIADRRGAVSRRAIDGALVSARGRLHLTLRLGARVLQVADRSGAQPLRLRLFGATAGVLADLAIAGQLRRRSNVGLGWRLAADTAERLAWKGLSVSELTAEDMDSLIGFPLSFEAAARLGPAGISVPAVAFVSQRLGTLPRHGRPFGRLFGAALGLSVRLAQQRNGRRLLADRAARLVDEQDAAELAGLQASFGPAAPFLDELQRITALMDFGGKDGAVRRDLASQWRQDIAARARRGAGYLADVLSSWEQHRNRSPWLHDLVEIRCAGPAATLIIGPSLRADLERALDELGLRGVVHVSAVVDGNDTEDLRLRVGDHEVTLVRSRPELVVNLLPLALGALACFLIVDRLSTGGGDALWAAAGPAGGVAVLALAAHGRGLRQAGADPTLFVVASSLLTAWAAGADIATRSAAFDAAGRPPHMVGRTVGAQQVALGMAAARMGRPAVRWMAASAAATVIMGWTLGGRTDGSSGLAYELVGPAVGFSFGQAIEAAVRQQAHAADEVTSAKERRIIAARRSAGEATVWAFVDEALADAKVRFDDERLRLPEHIEREVARRLEGLRARRATRVP